MLLAATCGLLPVRRILHDADLVTSAYVVLCACLAVSFVNQVLLTLLLRGSVGKLLLGLRVVADPGGRPPREGGHPRPALWRTVARWLVGLYPPSGWPSRTAAGSHGTPANRYGVLLVPRRALRDAGLNGCAGAGG